MRKMKEERNLLLEEKNIWENEKEKTQRGERS
jgi:hypothetical protein